MTKIVTAGEAKERLTGMSICMCRCTLERERRGRVREEGKKVIALGTCEMNFERSLDGGKERERERIEGQTCVLSVLREGIQMRNPIRYHLGK